MIYSNRFIDVAFGDSDFEKLLRTLKPGGTLSAAVLLTALDGESEDVLQEAFDHLLDLDVALDISDLPKGDGTGEAALRLRREAQLAANGTLLTALEETDPLRLYLEELAAIPTFGDIRILAEDLANANRDEREEADLWNQILNLSLSHIFQLACEYTGRGVLLLDLIQEGSMGLWSALPCFVGDDFEVFRDWYIRQSMAKAITLQARAGGVGQKMRQALEDYRSVDERLLTELGRNPTLEEIAEHMHMSLQETAVVADMLKNARTMNRVKAEPEPEEEEDPNADQSVEDTAYFQARQRISELLSGLEEQDAKLLSLRFGLEGGLSLSPEEAGKRMGLTAEEVVAREAAALAKLRNKG